MANLTKNDAPKQLKNVEKKLGDDDFIVSKTDLKGKITYCNRIFSEMAGYSIDDLLGSNHNLIRHPEMPKLAFEVAWDLIQKGEEFFGFVKNLCKDGAFYWVFTYITADFDKHGKIIGYTSFRRKPNPEAVKAIEPVYKQLIDAEKSGGTKASMALLTSVLHAANTDYTAFVIGLQGDYNA